MQSVYVHPDYRKQGVFRTLFKHIENLAHSHPQVKALRLHVMHSNNTGQRTYQSLGMNEILATSFLKKSISPERVFQRTQFSWPGEGVSKDKKSL